MPKKEMTSIGSRPNTILDGIITGIFGPDTSQMTEAEGKKVEQQRAQKQDDAYALANSARTNPGQAFMNGPDLSGGNDIMKIIGQVVKMFGAGG
jgi:hypothetical protein